MLPIWDNVDGDASNTDISGEPAYLAVDRSKYAQTNPDDTANDFWLIFAWAGDFDTVALLNTNLHTITGLTVDVEIADDGAFATNASLIDIGIAPTTSEYTAFLGHVYSGSGYIRFHFSAPSGFTPYVGETWVGRRRQLRTAPAQGGDINARASTAAASDGGPVQSVTGLALGRLTPKIILRTNDRDSTLEDEATLRAWWSEIGYGTAPFLWVPLPASAQDTVHLMRTADKALAMSKIGPVGGRDFGQAWVEMPPFTGVT